MKKIKKYIAVFLVVLMFISFVPVTVSASATSGTCGDNLYWTYNTKFRLLTIMGTGEMYDFTNSADYEWKEYAESATAVYIKEGVTSIGRSAFSGFSNIIEVLLPDTLMRIGNSAFYNCDNLLSVSIPVTVTTISGSAFSNCDKLEEVTIDNGSVKIGGSAFSYCGKLASLVIGDDVHGQNDGVIGQYAFNGCYALENVSLGDGIFEIQMRAFADCNKLKSLKVPDSVTTIGAEAFVNCNSSFELMLGKNVSLIRIPYDFYSNPAAIYVDSDNPYFSNDESGAFFNKDKTTLIHFPKNKGIADYVIPDTVEVIGACSFELCSLESVTIPDSVKVIEKSAFERCYQLEKIIIPDSVTDVGENAFVDCKSLTSAFIGNGVKVVKNGVFNKCTNLQEVIIGENVEKISWRSFADCQNLKQVLIPAKVERIDSSAFDGCLKLGKVIVCCENVVIDSTVFNNCSKIKDVYVLDYVNMSVQSFGNSGFLNAKRHNVKVTSSLPTCIEYGRVEYTCDCCSLDYTEYTSNPTGHTINDDGVCEVCGEKEINKNFVDGNQMLSMESILAIVIKFLSKLFGLFTVA